eukprot:8777496-Alexandrium_andersonii.AAC.1
MATCDDWSARLWIRTWSQMAARRTCDLLERSGMSNVAEAVRFGLSRRIGHASMADCPSGH